jgi:hypothetical protein
VDVKHLFCEGDTLNVLPVKREVMPFEISVRKIADMAGARINRALTNRLVLVRTEWEIREGDMLRKAEER